METRIPEAVFAVGEQDATRLNLQEGQRITVKAGETTVSLPVQVIFTYRLYWLPSWFSTNGVTS